MPSVFSGSRTLVKRNSYSRLNGGEGGGGGEKGNMDVPGGNGGLEGGVIGGTGGRHAGGTGGKGEGSAGGEGGSVAKYVP
eukprot:scaffold16183_cov89-Phaeocystis_antarctica.AAC.5